MVPVVEEAAGLDRALFRTVVAKVIFSKERLEVLGDRADIGVDVDPGGEGRHDNKSPCLGPLMGLGTARKGTQPALLAMAAPGDLIWGLTDAWL